jgi:ABC-type multidrug transport system ATPase subunit
VRTAGLRKQFGAHAVLDSVDLDVDPGTIAVLKGRNGAGKTTLLRILATLLRPDGGEAWVHGANVRTAGARVRSSIGVATVNERSLYWRMSALHNLRFFARTGHVPRQEEDARIEGLLDELGLTGVADRWVANLSAGQRQRVILARAALREPPVLLLDEPMRGLDEEGIDSVRAFLRRRAETGVAILVVAPTLGEFSGLTGIWLELTDGRVKPASDHSGDRPR